MEFSVLGLNLKLISILIILPLQKYKNMTDKPVVDWFKLVKTRTGLKPVLTKKDRSKAVQSGLLMF